MKHTVLFTIYFGLFFTPILRGQNLVVNPSFEMAADSNDLIPAGEFAVTKARGWTLPTRAQASLYSSIPMLATLNRAMNRWKFTAKEGNNVVGITTYGTLAGNEKQELREYVQGSLTRPLTVGKKYYVSYYVHFHVEGTNNIGFNFLKTPLITDSVFRLPLKPLVNNTSVMRYSSGNIWQFVRDSFVARDNYKHFIIGNFFTNLETKVESNKYHYHKAYLDDVHIEETADDKMPPRTFDLLTENEPNLTAIIKEKPNETPLVTEPKLAETKVNKLVENKTKKTEPTPSSNVLKGDVLVLDKVFFPYNATTLEAVSSAQLDKLVAYLYYNKSMKILVKGHTSSEGSEVYNQKLSEKRAQAVVNYLMEKGITGERLAYKGYGKTQPIYLNDTEENRHKNRRVEFEIMTE